MCSVFASRDRRSGIASRRQFAKLARWLLDEHVSAARSAGPELAPGALRGFRDVIAVDATVVKVHDALSGIWRGTRTNSAMAALKVHVLARAFTGELLKYRVTAEAFGDSRGFGVYHEIRGCLLLLDRGYSSPSLWRRIHEVGGYLLTPLPADRDPIFVHELPLHCPWVPKEARPRRSRGVPRRRRPQPKHRRYCVYVTNAPQHLLPAEAVAATYRLR